MKKQNIFTVIGMALSFVIAIGGWALISRLIDIRSDALMSASGVSPIAMPIAVPVPLTEETGNGFGNGFRPLLTEQEIVSILRNRETVGRAIPHEPTPEQIDMDRAVRTAREWLSFIGDYLYIHHGLFTFYDITADLTQNQQRGSDGFLPPQYSFWTVTFYGRHATAMFLINAVEGQVWQTEISLTNMRPMHLTRDRYHYTVVVQGWGHEETAFYFETTLTGAGNMLDEFMSVIGIDAGEKQYDIFIPRPPLIRDYWTWPTTGVRKLFANEEAYAAVRIYGTSMDGERWYINSFTMRLGVN
ncbi:MAG: hypothetical protein FWC32_05595 [Firmicutes bacterium]|nr:hypothetical protein [Bacillota bacterium]